MNQNNTTAASEAVATGRESVYADAASHFAWYMNSQPCYRTLYTLMSVSTPITHAAAHDFRLGAQRIEPEFWQAGAGAPELHWSKENCCCIVSEAESTYNTAQNESAPQVTLAPMIHRSQEWIAIRFERHPQLEQLVRHVPGVRWTRTHRCWYLPMNHESYHALKRTLGTAAVFDETALRNYGAKRRAVAATYPQPEQVVKPATFVASPAWHLSAHNLGELERFVQRLKLMAYSNSTLTTYRSEFLQLLRLLRNRNVDTLQPDELRRYMVYAMEKQGISEQTAHSRINAIKFYFEQVLGHDKFFWEIPRPKKPMKLPKVLSERELERLFAAAGSLKHKAILFTAYSAGLRVSEVACLKIAHIDSDRMQILVAQAKGKKDRYVGLSVLLLDVLRAYMRQARPRPTTYLFEGYVPGTPLSSRSAQNVFRHAKQMAGIRKEVSFHALRHSFATHLLEKGIDIKYIKDLLGHFQIKTTERYLHVRREDLIQLVNPLDELYRNRPWTF